MHDEPEANTRLPDSADDAPDSVVAELTGSDLDDLFRDLAACAQLQHVSVKQSPAQRTAVTLGLDLVQARAMLTQPTTVAVQLRYLYDNALWIDTVTKQHATYRLLRLRHDQ